MTTALICALALGAARAADPVVGLAREEGYEAEVESYDYAAALKAKLLEHYVKEIAPPRFGTERGVRVAVQLSLSQLSDVNVARQEVEFYSWWRHSWRDPRLQWDPDDWGGVAELSFVGRGEHQEAWMPDDLVYEATSSVYQLPEVLVNAYASGSVLCGIQIFNPTSMCAYATSSTQALRPCVENSTRAIDPSKNQPNRLRFE